MGNQSKHYKMYKSGKFWVASAIVSFGMGSAVLVNNSVVSADTTGANQTQLAATNSETDAQTPKGFELFDQGEAAKFPASDPNYMTKGIQTAQRGLFEGAKDDDYVLMTYNRENPTQDIVVEEYLNGKLVDRYPVPAVNGQVVQSKKIPGSSYKFENPAGARPTIAGTYPKGSRKFVPPYTVTQITQFIDATTGKDVAPSVTQHGLEGQGYRTAAKVVKNMIQVGIVGTADGTMSPYNENGEQFKSVHNKDQVTVWTMIDARKGTMNLKIYNSDGSLDKDYGNFAPGQGAQSELNPYVQNSDVDYTYKMVGKTISVDKDGKEIPGVPHDYYPNNPDDPTKISDPKIPNIPGYTPIDKDGNPLKPGDPYPVSDPNDPTKDTPITYEKVPSKDVPSIPVDPNGNEIPTNKPFPPVSIPDDKKPGDEIEIPTKDLPDIPGYDKPDGDTVKVKVPEDGKKVEIPYTPTPTPDKKVPSEPVDPEGNKIPTDKPFPDVDIPGDKHPGDEIEIPTKTTSQMEIR